MFSEILQTFNDLDVPDDIEEVIKNGDFDIPKLDFMLAGNEFDKHPKMFLRQFQYIILICASGVFDGDKRLDPLMMDALFVAGQHFEKLKVYGYKWSDVQSTRSKNPKKNRFQDEELLEAFHACHAKNPHAMFREIAKYLRKVKKETGDRRPVPSQRTILRFLKDQGLDKLLPK